MLDSLHSTIAHFGQSGKRDLGVVEWDGAIREDLFLFVTFAGDQNHVARLGGCERQANGGCAIRLDGVLDACGSQTGFDFTQNCEGILGPGVVAGSNDEVARFARSLAHLGALGGRGRRRSRRA